MLGVGCRKGSPQITQVSLWSDEAGCYHNNFLLAVVTDAGKRFGLTVTQYDFSEPQYGKDECDRILCPMKSAIRRYCCEENDVLSAKDMRTALSECSVPGTIALVCLVNETQKTIELNKMVGFSKYHNFIYELNGIRVWRADGMGKGIVIPYHARHHRKTPRSDRSCCRCTLFSVNEARIHKASSSDEDQSSGLFLFSEPGCQMVFKKFSDLESHLHVGEHRQERRVSETVMTNSKEVGRKIPYC